LGIVAAGLAALGAAITSWAEVIGFSVNARLYRAARNSLGRLWPGRPEAAEASPELVGRYVADVEAVLLGEVRSWGQTWSGGRNEDESPAT
jgi:hypothetical protein